MKFLIDHNIPALLTRHLIRLGHDVIRVNSTVSDLLIAKQAVLENRILVTLDKDFANVDIFPPSKFNTVHIRIHPPEKTIVTKTFSNLLKKIPPEKFKGLILLHREGFSRIPQ